MTTPYTITELDALLNACVSFTEIHEPNFWAGNLAGRDGVSSDTPSVERMMDWVAQTDKGLLESLGFGKDNVVYYQLGREAKRVMIEGGFKKYLLKRKVREHLEQARIWAPIGISLLAAIVSILVWQSPKDSSKRIDDLTTQLNALRSDQEQTKAKVSTIRESVDTISASTNPTNPSDHFPAAPGQTDTGTSPGQYTGRPPGQTETGEPVALIQVPPDRRGPLDQPWLLVASVGMFVMAFFLLHQSAGFQKWVTAKDNAAPNAWAGFGLALALSVAMLVFSVVYWIASHPHPPLEAMDGPHIFLWVMSNRPSELAAGPLLGSLVPAAMAIFKFVTAGFIMRSGAQELPQMSRSAAAALAGAAFSLISLAGSVATLAMFFFWIKNP